MNSDVAAARRAHEALVQALRDQETAERNAVLRFADVYHRRLFRLLGFSSIHHYAREKLGFSDSKAAQFVRLAKDVKRLPTLARAIASDKVSWTKAREIGKVATPETEPAWVERATTTSHRELVRQVKQARSPKAPAAQVSMLPEAALPKGDPPIHFGFDLTPIQAAEVHTLMDRLQPGRSRGELFVAALAALVAAERGEQPAEKNCTRVQVAAYRCDTCSGVDVATTSGLKRLDPLSADTVSCDADHIDPHGNKQSSIPPRIRRQVLARDKHRCVRCGNTHHLNIHHRHRQTDGGKHTLENCVTACAPCHRLHHANEEHAVARRRISAPGPLRVIHFNSLDEAGLAQACAK